MSAARATCSAVFGMATLAATLRALFAADGLAPDPEAASFRS